MCQALILGAKKLVQCGLCASIVQFQDEVFFFSRQGRLRRLLWMGLIVKCLDIFDRESISHGPKSLKIVLVLLFSYGFDI